MVVTQEQLTSARGGIQELIRRIQELRQQQSSGKQFNTFDISQIQQKGKKVAAAGRSLVDEVKANGIQTRSKEDINSALTIPKDVQGINNAFSQSDKLVGDGSGESIFGTSALSGIVGSSDSAVAEDRQLTDTINGFNDPETLEKEEELRSNLDEILEEQERIIQSAQRSQIRRIESDFESQKSNIEKDQKTETAFLNNQLRQVGGFLGGSASGTGASINLSNTQRSEISTLTAAKNDAIRLAEEAATAEDFELAAQRAAQVAELEKQITASRQAFFDQSIEFAEEQRKVAKQQTDLDNQLRDDARSQIQSLLSTFGGFSLEDLDSNSLAQITNLADLAGIPVSLLNQPTLAETKEENAQQQRNISNAISQANLSIRQKQFDFSQSQFNINQREDSNIDLSTVDPELLTTVEEIRNAGGDITDAAIAALELGFEPTIELEEVIQNLFGINVGGPALTEFTPTQRLQLEAAGLINEPRDVQLQFLFPPQTVDTFQFDADSFVEENL